MHEKFYFYSISINYKIVIFECYLIIINNSVLGCVIICIFLITNLCLSSRLINNHNNVVFDCFVL